MNITLIKVGAKNQFFLFNFAIKFIYRGLFSIRGKFSKCSIPKYFIRNAHTNLEAQNTKL